MYQLLLILHVIVAVILVGLVLIQQGKGANIGASFGSGASNTVFGSQGAGGLLFKLTGGLALVFFLTSLTLSSIVSTEYKRTLVPIKSPSSEIDLPLPATPKK